MDFPINPKPASEFRYALEILEEHAHLGLDDQYAGTLREIIHRRIEDAEKATSGHLVQCAPSAESAESLH